MKNSKSVAPLSLDAAIAAHKKAIDDIKKCMEPAGKDSTLVLVPEGYDLQTTLSKPKLKRRPNGAGGYTEHFDADKLKLHVVMKIASISNRIFYELDDRRIVNAKYCARVGHQHEPILAEK